MIVSWSFMGVWKRVGREQGVLNLVFSFQIWGLCKASLIFSFNVSECRAKLAEMGGVDLKNPEGAFIN